MKCCKTFVKTFVPIAFGVGTFVVGMGILVHHGRTQPSHPAMLHKPHLIDISVPRPAPAPAPLPREPRLDADTAASPGWAETMLQEFPADVYASSEGAVKGLALQLPNLLADHSPGVVAVSAGGCVSPDMVRDFITAAGRLPEFKWTFRPQQASASDSARWIAELTRETRDDGAESGENVGAIRLTLRRDDQSIDASVDYADKSWLTREADASPVQAGGDWVVAQSSRPESSAEAAEDSARRAAADVLRRIVHDRSNNRRFHRDLDEGIVADRIDAALFEGRLIADRFVQRFSRPYGDVWRAALRVDASDESLRGLIQNARHETIVQRDHRRAGFAAAAGLSLVIVALYVVLNAVTKGYFTWRLRGAAVAATLVGAVALMALFA